MILEKDITLKSRYGTQYTLRNIEPNKYLFVFTDECDVYMRVIYNKDGTIYAIDPPGGPFMSVGKTLVDAGEAGEKIIKHIKESPNGFVIQFE